MADNEKPSYDSRIERVIAFIGNNLDRPLTVEQLAAVAAMSRHHFQRVFTGNIGIPVGSYISAMRFKRACYQLAFHRDKPITEIAFDAQYMTSEAFSKAFAKFMGVSPRQFRQNPDFSFWSDFQTHLDQQEQTLNVEIVNFEATNLAVLEHKGPIDRVHQTLQRFVEWRKGFGPSPDISRTFNIFYDDPELVAAENYRMDVGAELFSTLKPNDFGVVKKTIPDLLCARLRHHGSWNSLGGSVRRFCSSWLPNSQFKAGTFPVFVERVNLFPQVPETDLITDIYLPITKKVDA